MPTCTRNGCKKGFNVEENTKGSCIYHSGTPVFHEGLKSWSCCADVNKPVLDFDEFMQIPGCQTGLHTIEAVKVPQKPQPSTVSNVSMSESTDGKEIYSSMSSTPSKPVTNLNLEPRPKPVSIPVVEEEDDLDAEIKLGTKCRRTGCGTEFESNETNRTGDGEGTICMYHPSPPIFHEGSKGYLCCKRRVLEFDEFLKIEGCKKGKHVFSPKQNVDAAPTLTTCRIDHYQTPAEVHVSVFAKQVDKTKSTVRIEQSQVHLDLHMPNSKRFLRTIDLFGPIKTDESKFSILGAKVDLLLKKGDGRSWSLLERTDQDLGSFNLTFGVGGRTGTVGGKDLVLDVSNKLKV